MADRHADDLTDQQHGRSPMKRRGILAVAGAALAGIVAKQASVPVSATAGTGPDGNLVLGSNSTNNTANYTSLRTQVISGLNFHGAVLLDCSSSPFQSSGDTHVIGISGVSRGTAAGVFGADYNGAVPAGYPAGLNAGVYGYTSSQGHSGVRGDGGTNGIGVSGVSANANAILGTTLGSPFNANAAVLGVGYTTGVEGDIAPGQAVANSVAVKGSNQSTGAGGIGVQGMSVGTYGMYGTSSMAGGCGVRGDCTGGTGVLGSVSDGYGVLGQGDTGNGVRGYSNQNHAIVGQTGRAFFGGVLGIATLDNTVGIYGSTKSATGYNANAFAGYMDGNFVVANGFKSAAVKHSDGTHRLVYCMESPESWFEDFGKVKLVGGKAEVKLDADFAAIVQTDDYHVFLTTYGEEGNGLTVAQMHPDGFTVRERNKGASSLTFSYRIVAKRKDIKAERLARFSLVGKEKHDAKPPSVPPAPSPPDAPPRKA